MMLTGMELKFQVHTKIRKPIREVFDAVRNPTKLSKYFTTGGANGPMETGVTVNWSFHEPPVPPFPVHVIKVDENKLIVFEWDATDDYKTRVEIAFESLGPSVTLVRISESGWREDEKGVKGSYDNCGGWAQMLCCMKAFLEFGINLREGAY